MAQLCREICEEILLKVSDWDAVAALSQVDRTFREVATDKVALEKFFRNFNEVLLASGDVDGLLVKFGKTAARMARLDGASSGGWGRWWIGLDPNTVHLHETNQDPDTNYTMLMLHLGTETEIRPAEKTYSGPRPEWEGPSVRDTYGLVGLYGRGSRLVACVMRARAVTPRHPQFDDEEAFLFELMPRPKTLPPSVPAALFAESRVAVLTRIHHRSGGQVYTDPMVMPVPYPCVLLVPDNTPDPSRNRRHWLNVIQAIQSAVRLPSPDSDFYRDATAFFMPDIQRRAATFFADPDGEDVTLRALSRAMAASASSAPSGKYVSGCELC